MDFKQTLLTPKTNFEMRGNLPQKEPKLLEKWEKSHLYQKMLDKNKDKTSFVLHDGPPYANGDIHTGHAMNKILKDIIIRYKTMKGFYTPYVPGWDTHGLPIETALTKKGVNRKEMSVAAFRELCQEYALTQVERQKTQFKRLGSIGDYDHPYITLHKEFEALQIKIFGKMALDGLIYKGMKPVFWSPSSESALAEAEIEYHDKKSSSIFVKLFVKNGQGKINEDAAFVIWTTTPWTIPANLAITLNAKFEYGLFNTNRGKLIFLVSSKEEMMKELSLEKAELIKTFLGKELEGVVALHPFYNRDSIVILGDHVTDDAGSGCVHTAPGHGEDDFIVGKQYGLEPLCPVDYRGVMTEEAGARLEGKFYEKANAEVITWLDEVGALLAVKTITHSYPHDWRTKQPVIYRVTAQWFASIDKIRKHLLEEIKQVKWYPSWGEVRLGNMIADRGDWCISRQRVWGVPIPIIYAEDDTPIIDNVLFAHFSKLFEAFGSNVWFSKDVKELLPEGYTHSLSPNGIFRKETDIMDVWFDSGSSHTAAMQNRGFSYPHDLYLEGSDQYRGWFNSSLIVGTAYHGQAPYRTVVSHGFVLDGKGNKMSKSIGNTVDPLKVMDQYGADILRLWIASVDYQSDVRISDDLMKQVAESYRKIRNTFRFLLGNLSDGDEKSFNYQLDGVNDFEFIDLCILNKLNKVINNCLDYYDQYNYQSITQELMNFMAVDLSSFYLDISKDVLYCDAVSSKRRRQIQTVIYRVLDALLRLFTPILPFTMEEICSFFLPEVLSPQLLDMVNNQKVDEQILNHYNDLMHLRSDVLKALELARGNGIIGSAQEAKIRLKIDHTKVLNAFTLLSKEEQQRFFIVSKIDLVSNIQGSKYEVSQVEVEAYQGVKCKRCWNHVEHINEEEVCPRCAEVLKGMK